MPGLDRAFFVWRLPLSIRQRDPRRIAAHVRRRVERRAVDRAVEVFARERRVADLRREGVILELAVARQHFRAGIEPRARGDVNAGARALLVGAVGTVRPVIDTSVLVVFWLGLGAGRSRAERDEGSRSKQDRKLARSGEFSGHFITVIVRPRRAAGSPNLVASIVAVAGPSSLGQLRHTPPE